MAATAPRVWATPERSSCRRSAMRCSSPWSWSSCRPTSNAPDTTPPGYTVKIVDNIPAGDLGTHLPRLTQDQPHPEHRTEQPKPAVEQHKTPPPAAARQRQDRDRVQYGRLPDADAHSGADARTHRGANAGAHCRANARSYAEPTAPGRRTSRLRGRRLSRVIAVRCRRRLPCPGTARIRGPSRMKS